MRNPSLFHALAALALVALISSSASALVLLSPGDPIIAIDTDPAGSDSRYPGAEGPSKILDGILGTKYLNFAKENTGFIVTPSSAAAVQSFVITTANDAWQRDPASWELFGTDDAITSADNSLGVDENWTLIGSGGLALPDIRGVMGPVVSFGNATSYSSYRMVFPTLKDAGATNSMQIDEIDMFESNDGSGTDVLAAGNPILAIDVDEVPASSYPGGEPPANVINGDLAKYLNFGAVNSGFIVTPSIGSSKVTGFQITTANDSPERDPAGWELYGTDATILSTDNSTGDAESWMLIDSGIVDLPDDRDTLGPMVAVDGADFYTSYKMLFTGLKDAGEANSMQIAEVQFEGVIPEPSSVMLILSGLVGLGLFGYRRMRVR